MSDASTNVCRNFFLIHPLIRLGAVKLEKEYLRTCPSSFPRWLMMMAMVLVVLAVQTAWAGQGEKAKGKKTVYPEVWGVELPTDGVDRAKEALIFQTADDRILISYWFETATERVHRIHDFFGQTTVSKHASLVAGVMVSARDGEGAVGVAYDATLSGHYFRGTGDGVTLELDSVLPHFKKYDVVNNSWGPTSDNFTLTVVPLGALHQGIHDAIHEGRDGLGTVIVYPSLTS